MDPRLSPTWIAAIFAAVALMMLVAIVTEQWRRRRDRADGVLIAWDDLRLTNTQLIVGCGRDAPRLPLAGLKAVVDIAAAPGQVDDQVHLRIENAEYDIRRSQTYSYGASGGAQMFAIKFNSLSGHAAPHQPGAAADTGGYPDLRAA